MNIFYEYPNLVCGVCGKPPFMEQASKDGKLTNVAHAICQTDYCEQRGKSSYVPMKVAVQCSKEAI